jgi:hypothetical protein
LSHIPASEEVERRPTHLSPQTSDITWDKRKVRKKGKKGKNPRNKKLKRNTNKRKKECADPNPELSKSDDEQVSTIHFGAKPLESIR